MDCKFSIPTMAAVRHLQYLEMQILTFPHFCSRNQHINGKFRRYRMQIYDFQYGGRPSS